MLASLYIQAFISRLSPKHKGPSILEARVWALWNQHNDWPLVEPTKKELEDRARWAARRAEREARWASER